MLAQRAASEGPRWTRADEVSILATHRDGLREKERKGVVPREKTRASLEGALKIYSKACFPKLTDIGDHSPIVASFEIDSQGRTSRLFHYVCLRCLDKARMVGRAMTGYGMAGSIVAPDNQRSHLIQLHFIRADTFTRLRWLVVLNTIRGTGLTSQRPVPASRS